ncbi:protein of unknown function [endosymbiont DhMRE of Dentiscutata heterogama]|uniref:hypothetical protein n=1 Tax=endosymbiont DhMRE of Dentiscutata heterogama TaxID=1609546 RepID=UPI000629DB0F|nr:hypothetical protein [endosymbiont DhMRE of Dentiscutata heterogama]CFW93274.1 protein of unknown function [endosymbiont DhMRE of Dentiscutata heterogama]
MMKFWYDQIYYPREKSHNFKLKNSMEIEKVKKIRVEYTDGKKYPDGRPMGFIFATFFLCSCELCHNDKYVDEDVFKYHQQIENEKKEKKLAEEIERKKFPALWTKLDKLEERIRLLEIDNDRDENYAEDKPDKYCED